MVARDHVNERVQVESVDLKVYFQVAQSSWTDQVFGARPAFLLLP